MELKKLILCVDDEKIVLNSLKEQLMNQLPHNYKIDVAQSGMEALEIIEEYKEEGYDILLVISDYVMPGMQGDEFLAKVHQDYPESVKILLTGQANLEGISNIINQAGLFRYIQKPWEREDLVLATVEAIKSFEKDRTIEAQNKSLIERNEALEKWANAVVNTLSMTLDKRDTTTSGHSNRMADFAVAIARSIQKSNDPHFECNGFDENSIEALRIAALLHDVGKIGIKENILLKDARIHYDHLEAILNRFNLYRCDLKHQDYESLTKDEKMFLNQFEIWTTKLKEINIKGGLNVEDVNFIAMLSLLEISHINNSQEEFKIKKLITDDEAEALQVRFGNLTKAEREIMESHAKFTYDILSQIPWPKELGDVASIASSHHERLDGSGYYNHLEGKDIPCASRILAVLDVYEALTSKDRPYRSPQSPEKAIEILEQEGRNGKMDSKIIAILKELLLNEEV
ncbi:MAG: response regulator [Clostridia bacterium]|nr:response regulator [Clostridia bacterium]